MEEFINNKKEDTTIELENGSSSSSSSSSSSTPTKSTEKISHIILLSPAWLQAPKVELRLDILIVEMVQTLLLNG
jgi:cellulase/cellobiase CelA1